MQAEVDEDEDEEDEDDFEDDDDFEDEDEYEGGENWFMEAAADKDGWVDMDKILVGPQAPYPPILTEVQLCDTSGTLCMLD